MIEPDVRNAVYQLHQQGMSLREISRCLHLSRNAVRRIVKQQGKPARRDRRDKKQIDPQLLERLYRECDGWMQRMHEKLVEEEGIQVGYSTLTRMLRELGLSRSQPERCDRVPDEPGAEMQHDTTLYRVKLGKQSVPLIASLIYLRYSKRRYLKFYRVFNRFAMKCFLHEALMFWGHAAGRCIIDNTNLARLRGAGSRAVIVAEMETFSQRYGFRFVCHAIDHPNRKAGNERSFWSVETGFLPGRTFSSLEDLNQQARQWASHTQLPRVHRYLSQQRGLSTAILASLIEQGKLYADARGNAVFVMQAGQPNRPVGAELRGTGRRVWRGLAAGTSKNAGYFWIGDPGAQHLVLCESAIDAISCHQLHAGSLAALLGRPCLCISTAGVRPDAPWLSPLLARGYHIYCGFDADDPGDTASRQMLTRHRSIQRLRPPRHDWNDVLTTASQ